MVSDSSLYLQCNSFERLATRATTLRSISAVTLASVLSANVQDIESPLISNDIIAALILSLALSSY